MRACGDDAATAAAARCHQRSRSRRGGRESQPSGKQWFWRRAEDSARLYVWSFLHNELGCAALCSIRIVSEETQALAGGFCPAAVPVRLVSGGGPNEHGRGTCVLNMRPDVPWSQPKTRVARTPRLPRTASASNVRRSSHGALARPHLTHPSARCSTRGHLTSPTRCRVLVLSLAFSLRGRHRDTPCGHLALTRAHSWR